MNRYIRASNIPWIGAATIAATLCSLGIFLFGDNIYFRIVRYISEPEPKPEPEIKTTTSAPSIETLALNNATPTAAQESGIVFTATFSDLDGVPYASLTIAPPSAAPSTHRLELLKRKPEEITTAASNYIISCPAWDYESKTATILITPLQPASKEEQKE